MDGPGQRGVFGMCRVFRQIFGREGEGSSSVGNNQIGERKVVFVVLVQCLCGP